VDKDIVWLVLAVLFSTFFIVFISYSFYQH